MLGRPLECNVDVALIAAGNLLDAIQTAHLGQAGQIQSLLALRDKLNQPVPT